MYCGPKISVIFLFSYIIIKDYAGRTSPFVTDGILYKHIYLRYIVKTTFTEKFNSHFINKLVFMMKLSLIFQIISLRY